MAIYTVSRSNVTLNTSNDIMTVIGASGHTMKLRRVSLYGLGTASAANEIVVQRSTGGTTGGGAITPGKTGTTKQGAANFVVDTTWGTQPSLTSNEILARMGVNAN